MKVVHVITTDGGNGAAIGAYRLHCGLRRFGIDSKMFVAEKRTADPDVIAFQPSRELAARLRRRVRSTMIARSLARHRRPRSADAETFSDDRSPHGAEVLSQLPDADVVNVHGMLNFIDYRPFLSRVPAERPVVRTLRDMSFFTGGCHYSGGCDRYTRSCGACPQLNSGIERDVSRRIWARKRAAFDAVAAGRLHLVAISDWIAGEARRSTLLRDFPITVIPNAVDTEVFCPRDRAFARHVLGISRSARVVLFVAEPITRRLKGFGPLVEALEGLRAMPDLLLVSVGSGHPPVTMNVPYLNLGRVAQERLLSLIYSAADVFVIPSFQEAFGKTAIEAMACGTPVIGFAVGGILDSVRPGVTGLLVPVGDVGALRTAIAELLGDPAAAARMAASSRRVAVEEYGLDAQARRYADVYRSLLR